MAKAVKPKKVKAEAEEVIPPVIEDTQIPEPGDTPPSVTLDEVEEIVIQEPKEEIKKEPEVVRIHNVSGDTVWQSPITDDLTMEQKILNFIESRQPGEIRMNDFLKSLFPVPKFGEPPLWTQKGESKRLRIVLDELQKQRLIQVVNNMHLKLGQFYHEGESQQTKHHNLNTVTIVVKK